MAPQPFGKQYEVLKVDRKLGLVLGYAIVCKVEGEDYFDTQGDHIPEAAMLEAATDFMVHSRTAKEGHKGDDVGSIVFAWPMTTEIAKAFGMDVKQTGLMIALKPDGEDMLHKFETGELTGFSIGGSRGVDEEV